jgi:hypothetical protein
MATDAQINANRQNAQKSTGPVTAEGKAAVSQNALKHGLFAVQDVLTTENQQEFNLLRDQMLAQLAPAGAVESMLAHRAVSLAWRLKRTETMQTQAIEEMVESHISTKRWRLGRRTPKDPTEEPEYLALGRVAKEDWCGEKLIERLFEYERRIEKSLYKTMAELRAMQLMRRRVEAAQPQGAAQADAKANSEKQSQSGVPESPCAELPQRSDLDPEKLIAFAKSTWGEPLPQWVRAGLERLGVFVDEAEALPDALEPIASPQTQGNAAGKGAALSLSSL